MYKYRVMMCVFLPTMVYAMEESFYGAAPNVPIEHVIAMKTAFQIKKLLEECESGYPLKNEKYKIVRTSGPMKPIEYKKNNAQNNEKNQDSDIYMQSKL